MRDDQRATLRQLIGEAKANVEGTLRARLAKREFDSATTAEIAKAIGASEASTLKYLKKLEDEGFKAEDGSTLAHGEQDAGQFARKGQRGGDRPSKFYWFFT